MNIKLKNISKRYEGNIDYTLENINLDIESGEFVALLGPSGCGKTTLLRMVAGLNSITKGELIFGNTKVNNIEPKNRDLAMVFQSYALYPHMTVYKNMAYSLQIKGVKKEQIDTRVKSVAKILEIEHLLFNKPSEISGGQRQRVALGRAVVRKPSIFLMDEPLSNLDAKLRESMRVELVKIHKLAKSTTLYVTHDQLEAMTMADKIVLFNNSKIQQTGTPTEMYNKPANLFVANFIGSPSMNFIDIKKINGKFIVSELKQKFTLSDKTLKKLGRFDEVVIGIRAEKISLHENKPKCESIRVIVSTSELLGKETVVNVEYFNKKKIQILLPKQVKYKIGQELFITFKETDIHFFDKKTTDRI